MESKRLTKARSASKVSWRTTAIVLARASGFRTNRHQSPFSKAQRAAAAWRS
jgi:hypothetical protein